MIKVEQERTIQTREDVAGIIGIAEQQFALLLLERSSLKILYESVLLEHTNGSGKREGTQPDFLITNKKNGTQIFVEITTAEQFSEGNIDAKEKQRRVMQSVAPDIRYVVLYRHNLEKIQSSHPEYDFFQGKKIRGGSSEYD